jgi:hypothetical protein
MYIFDRIFTNLIVFVAICSSRYIKNESPFLFLQLDADGKGGFNTVDEGAIRGLHRNKHYYEHRIPKKKKKSPSQDDEDAPAYDVVKLQFVSKWLEDPQILTSTKICCDPSRPYGLVPVSGGMAYNTWPGFEAAKLPAVPESMEQEAMERFYDHILKCVQDGEVAVYLMNYFANIFQRPWAKTKVAILLQGVEGCGKGTIFDTIRAVMGDTVSFQTGNPTQHLFSRFSTGFKNKAFVQVPPPCLLTHYSHALAKKPLFLIHLHHADCRGKGRACF